MAVSAAASDATDRILGSRYRLEAPIGHGGMSTVYRARDEALGRAVAVKLYNAGSVEDGRQEGELSVLASLDHHSLVQLFDAGVERDADGRAARYIVMALVAGPTLQQRIAADPIAPRHIAEIGYDIAEALEYIHAQNVIHRDIKPSNILLVDYGNDAQRARAKLTDFGIAIADDMERMTAQGATTGTAAYLSPEQASGGEVGPASDVYALGLVLLECFTRTVEFGGSIVESAVARLSRNPRIPRHLPEHWTRLLTAMTARDPAQRPVGGELVAVLRQVVIADSARHKDAPEPVFLASTVARELQARPDILTTVPNAGLQRVTALAARLFSAPISIVSVIDDDKLSLQSYYGAEVEEIARQVDLSSTAAPLSEPFIVEDGRTDPRVKNSPLVTGALGLRFYAGVPLKRDTGEVMGTLSVLGFVPGIASPDDIANLEDLAALAVAQLETQQTTRESIETVAMSDGDR